MAGIARHAQENRVVASLRCLQRGGELVGMAGHHAVVMIARQENCRGVARALVHVVERRVRPQVSEVRAQPIAPIPGSATSPAGRPSSVKRLSRLLTSCR